MTPECDVISVSPVDEESNATHHNLSLARESGSSLYWTYTCTLGLLSPTSPAASPDASFDVAGKNKVRQVRSTVVGARAKAKVAVIVSSP